MSRSIVIGCIVARKRIHLLEVSLDLKVVHIAVILVDGGRLALGVELALHHVKKDGNGSFSQLHFRNHGHLKKWTHHTGHKVDLVLACTFCTNTETIKLSQMPLCHHMFFHNLVIIITLMHHYYDPCLLWIT